MGLLASLSTEFFAYYKAILARAMFGTHALVTVWRTTVVMGVVYWSLTLGVFLLAVEYIVTMWVRMGKEWPWVSPSTLCYLSTTASALWIQKLENLGHVQSINGSYLSTLPALNLELDFSASDWLLLTEQTMMVTIIISRWLLPKGEMSNKDLSTLLLLYLALSADILDFSTIFDQKKVAEDEVICYVILFVWTGSLVQFILVLTSTTKVEKEAEKIDMKSLVCSSEIWQILVQVGLQDLPFLLIRVLALLQYQVFNYTIIFFVCKNTLVIALEVYHLVALCLEQRRKLKKRRERMNHLKSKMQSYKTTLNTMGKFKNAFGSPKTESTNNDENPENDDGLGEKNSTKNTEKNSFLTKAMKIHQQKSKGSTQSEEPKSFSDNSIKHESGHEAEVAKNDGQDENSYPKTGSSLANANNNNNNNNSSNRWRDNPLNSSVLTKKFPKTDRPTQSTPPVSHLQLTRIRTPLSPSFDSRPTVDANKGNLPASSASSRNSSASSGVGHSVASTSSIFDTDDRVF